MQRYFLELSYKGKAYHGWQIQPNAPSIQEVIETEISKILQNKTPITGCGRTDAGVHASCFFAHFECEQNIEIEKLAHKLNRMLPPDIAIRRCFPVGSSSHARFDAVSRRYRYDLHFRKDPFKTDTSYFFPFAGKCDWQKVKRAASILPEYAEFFPFCKSRSDTEHYKVELREADWTIRKDSASFHITGNRFLRGMVRLIVGACLHTGLSKMELKDIRKALDEQKPLRRSWSAPAQGLYLVDVKYPESILTV